MRHYRLTAAVVAAVLACPVNFSSYADGKTVLNPVYEDFNENDVNGAVVINVPKDVTADVLITFDSPETNGAHYYEASVESGSYSFPLEGRDETESDFRNYNIYVSLTGGDYGVTSVPFTETVTVRDVNDNPGSYKDFVYSFKIDDKKVPDDWEITKDDGNVKTVAVHLNGVKKGDIDFNGMVDASDASGVLSEYSAVSVGEESTITPRQRVCVDVNGDGTVNATDASMILSYYAINATGGKADWSEV